jgi:hypothetical protein
MDENALTQSLSHIHFPAPDSNEARGGNDDVQVLHVAKSVSHYWEEDPQQEHLHIIVQEQCTSPCYLISICV